MIKFSEPITPEQREAMDDLQRKNNKVIADRANELAQRLLDGDRELSNYDVQLIAASLKAQARRQLKWSPSREQGAPVKVPQEDYLCYRLHIRDGGCKTEAIRRLARDRNVSDDTMRKALARYDKDKSIRSTVDSLLWDPNAE